MVMIYRGGLVLARKEVCGKFWFVKVYLLLKTHDSPLLKLLYCTLFHNYSHGSKIFQFQANSNLIGHLQLESCKMGKLPARKEVCGKFWFVKVYLLLKTHDSPLLKLLYCTLFHNYSHGSKIFQFQANSNLIGHLQLESCKMGKLPVQRKERKIKHTQIALLLHVLH